MKSKLIISCLFLFLFSGYSIAGTKPGLLVDSGQITKKAILKSRIRGTVTKIQIGNFDQLPGNEIAILGQTGVWLLSSDDYNLIKTYEFKDKNGKTIWFGLTPELLDINNDGIFEIMKGGTGFGEVGLLDNKGKLLWTFQPHPKLHPKKMIYGDLNKDNSIEFYVADYTGLYRLDHKGNINWKASNEKFYDINIIEDKQFKKPLLIGLTRKKEFQIFNSGGRIIKRFSPEFKKYRFDIINWPDSNKSYILTGLTGFYKCKMFVMDLNGKIIFDYKLKKFPFYHVPRGLAIKFDKEKKPYLAVLANSRSSVSLTQLSIFSPSGELIYQEILNMTRGLCVNSCKKDQNEVLLVGDGCRAVWEYSLNPKYKSQGQPSTIDRKK